MLEYTLSCFQVTNYYKNYFEEMVEFEIFYRCQKKFFSSFTVYLHEW